MLVCSVVHSKFYRSSLLKMLEMHHQNKSVHFAKNRVSSQHTYLHKSFLRKETIHVSRISSVIETFQVHIAHQILNLPNNITKMKCKIANNIDIKFSERILNTHC